MIVELAFTTRDFLTRKLLPPKTLVQYVHSNFNGVPDFQRCHYYTNESITESQFREKLREKGRKYI